MRLLPTPPQLAGTADFTANASGTFTDSRSYQVMLNAEGRDVTINGQPAGTLTLGELVSLLGRRADGVPHTRHVLPPHELNLLDHLDAFDVVTPDGVLPELE